MVIKNKNVFLNTRQLKKEIIPTSKSLIHLNRGGATGLKNTAKFAKKQLALVMKLLFK